MNVCDCVVAVTTDERESHCRNCGLRIRGVNVEKSSQSTTTVGGDLGAAGVRKG